ncbi:hypothetical protein FRB99_007587, partial [Tulasnella sp. 403]
VLIAHELSRLPHLRELFVAGDPGFKETENDFKPMATKIAEDNTKLEVIAIHKIEYCVRRTSKGPEVDVCEVDEDEDDWLRQWPTAYYPLGD